MIGIGAGCLHMKGDTAAFLFLSTALLLISGCSGSSDYYSSLDFRADSDVDTRDGRGTLEVFYVTSRAATGAASVSAAFGHERGKDPVCGVGRVRVPRDHQIGGDPITRALASSRKRGAFEVEDLDAPVAESELIALIDAGMRKRQEVGHDRNLLVFIHGYNTTFPANVTAGARLAYDLGGGMVPLIYSWPTRGTLQGYPDDENNVDLAARHLAGLLRRVHAGLPNTRIHVVAHSMGARVLTQTLIRLTKDPNPPRFKNVVFAAADVDATEFERAVMDDGITTLADRTTLYVSDNDRALQASETLHGRLYRRAGQGGATRLAVPGVETVDVSLSDGSPLGHGYAGDNRAVIMDLSLLLVHDLPALRRNLLHVTPENGQRFWLIRP